MTQQALRELVAKWRQRAEVNRVKTDVPLADTHGNTICSLYLGCAEELESLLGEQREAQGAERPQGEVHALPHSPPPVPEVLAPVYRFLIGRCLYWKLLIGDDAELPEAPWYGIVQIQIKRSGKLEYCEAKYEAPLFGGPPQWSSWNASEGNYEVLKWLKQWNLPIDVAPPLAESVGDELNPKALEALKSYQQADRDGIMVNVSRQALDEAIAILERRHMQQEPKP